MDKNILPLKSVKDLPQLLISKVDIDGQYNDCEIQGGIIENSKYCWIVYGPLLEIICIKTGRKIAVWKFGSHFKNQYTCVSCICDIPISKEIGSSLLAIGLHQGLNDGVICIFTIQGCRILSSINIGEAISNICLVDPGGTLAGPLSAFDGILAVASVNGNVYLLDICKQICIDALILGPEYGFDETRLRQCIKTPPNPNANYELLKEMAQAKDEHIALNIYAIEILGPVTSICMINQISALVIGSSTGAFVIIDLIELKVLHKANSNYGSIERLAFQEPSDDPRAHCFLWVLHKGGKNIMANLHQLIFRKKKSINLCTSSYQDFLSCHLKYSMLVSQVESRLISCQVIQKTFQDEYSVSLCTFAWKCKNESYLCIFDIDQWYKTGMAASEKELENIVYVKYGIQLDNTQSDRLFSQYIDIKLDASSISAFKSCQSYDEYYQPGSLSFDCDLVTTSKSYCFHWPGSQMHILQKLIKSGSSGLIDPESLYLECLSACLIPVFHDNSFSCETSLVEQREMLLSIALDYGYISFLQKCTIAWADGSHAGNEGGPTLYTMVDWIWNQAERIKIKANKLCIQLFDYSGVPFDRKTQKQFTHLLSQIHMLLTLMHSISEMCKNYLSPKACNKVCVLTKLLEILSQYFDVVQFLLNLGLLPEVAINNTVHFTDGRQHVPYPAFVLRKFYSERRSELSIDNKFEANWGCKLLFIDAFIEYECEGSNLRSIWLKDSGSPFYPPISIQAMLWIYLLPDVKLENKHILFMYMLLDLASLLDTDKSSLQLQMMQFSEIFKMNELVVKNARAFWYLDQKEFEPILEFIANPLNEKDGVSQWQHNLLLSSLVAQGAFKEALQVLRLPGPSVSPDLKIKILLENQLLCEAFECQRIWGGKDLLRLFFEGCIKNGNISSIMGLSLNHAEEYELGEFLRNSNSSKADNLQVLYYLQRSRFAEAISINRNSQFKKSNKFNDNLSKTISTREMIINAFQNTLPEVMTKLTKYCDNEKKLFETISKVEKPTPLSVSIVRMPLKEPQSKSSSLLAFLEKSTEVCKTNCGTKRALAVEDMPFLRTPKMSLLNGKEDSILVFPKSNEYEEVNGIIESPAKRQKLATPGKSNSSHREKSLAHKILRLNSTPYNFDKLLNHSMEKQSDQTSDSSLSLSTLSSPSNKSLITSLVHTPLIKRKSISSMEDCENRSIVKRHSILKMTNKSLTKHLSNTSQGGDSPRSIHFAETDSLIEYPNLPCDFPENDDMDADNILKQEVLFDVKPRDSLRHSITFSDKSKTTTVTTSSTSTADEIFYSLSSNGTDEKEKKTEADSKQENVNSYPHSEDSNHSVQFEKSDSICDLNNKYKYKEIVKSGPKCRRSLRLSKSNDSLHKLSTPSPIGKGKVKAGESRSLKLGDLPMTEKKSLARVALENNACKVQQNVLKRTKGPKARDPIHSVSYNQTNAICEEIINKSNENEKILLNEDFQNEKSKLEPALETQKNMTEGNLLSTSINKGASNLGENQNKTSQKHDLEVEGDKSDNFSKTDAIFNNIYCEDKLEENDLYMDIMSDINESNKQNTHNSDYIDVEPMQSCPDIILSEDKNMEQNEEKIMKNSQDLPSVYSCSETTTHPQNSRVNETQNQIEICNKEVIVQSENNLILVKENVEEIQEEIIENYSSNQEVVKVQAKQSEISNAENVQETICIDSSDDESVAELNKGVIYLNEESSESLCISESFEEEDDDDYDEKCSEEEEIKSIDKNILANTKNEIEFSDEESECAMEIVDNDFDEESENSSEQRDAEKFSKEMSQSRKNQSDDQNLKEIQTIKSDSVDDQGDKNLSDNEDDHETAFEDMDVNINDQTIFIDDNELPEITSNNDSKILIEESTQSVEVNIIDQAAFIDEEDLPEVTVNENAIQIEISDIAGNSILKTIDNNIDKKLIEKDDQIYEKDIYKKYDDGTLKNNTDEELSEAMLTDSELPEVTSSNITDKELNDVHNEAIIINDCELAETTVKNNSECIIIEENLNNSGDTKIKSDSGDVQANVFIRDDSTNTSEVIEDNGVYNQAIIVNDSEVPEVSLKENTDKVQQNVYNQEIISDVELPETNIKENSTIVILEETPQIDEVTKNKLNNVKNTIADNANITDDLSLEEDEVFVFIDNKSTDNIHSKVNKEKQSDLVNSNKDVSLNNKAKYCPTTDIFDMTLNTTVESCSNETDFFDKTFSDTPSSKADENKIIIISVDQVTQELTTPKTIRRRSRRLSGILQSDIIGEEDCDNSSVGSEMSVRSTRSRTRRLSQDFGTPKENTPRRSSRLRSTDNSPTSETESVTKSRVGRKKTVDSSPTVSSPLVSKIGPKGRRRSLLATISEPVIMEENSLKPNEGASNADETSTKSVIPDVNADKVEEYSKGRRLTRNQRSVLMRSLSSSEQVKPIAEDISEIVGTSKKQSVSKSESEDEAKVHGSECSPTHSESSSVQSSRRGAFLKAQSNMKATTPVTATKRTRRNSAQKKNDDSDDGMSNLKPEIEYKFSEPTDMATSTLQDVSISLTAVDSLQEDPFQFSPPKRILLSTIVEEDAASHHSIDKSDSDHELHIDCEPQKKVTKVKKGRSRKTTPSTRSSSRVNKKK